MIDRIPNMEAMVAIPRSTIQKLDWPMWQSFFARAHGRDIRVVETDEQALHRGTSRVIADLQTQRGRWQWSGFSEQDVTPGENWGIDEEFPVVVLEDASQLPAIQGRIITVKKLKANAPINASSIKFRKRPMGWIGEFGSQFWGACERHLLDLIVDISRALLPRLSIAIAT